MLTLYVDLRKRRFTSIDYNIIRSVTKDKILLRTVTKTTENDGVPRKPISGAVALTDTKEGILSWQAAGIPVIALSHEENRDEDLMKSPWLVLSTEALTPEYLLEVHHRYNGIPLTVAVSERCMFRELIPDDLPNLLALDREQEGNSAGLFFRETDTDPEAFLENYIAYHYPFYGYGIYAVIQVEKAEFLGLAGFYPAGSLPESQFPEGGMAEISFGKENAASRVEIGYVIKKSARRKGYAKECICTLTDYARQTLGFDEIIARIPADNAASIRTALSAGGRLKV